MSEITYYQKPKALFDQLSEIIQDKRGFVLTDSTVFQHVYQLNKKSLFQYPVLSIPEGESSKTFSETEKIIRWLLKNEADRQSVLICFGGGMITDIGGFAASIYKRGIAVIFIPTTLLAMCDAAIGGKNGVNFDYVKNQVGTFSTPDQILICPEFLSSLPSKELLSGYAEVVKHFLIWDAKSFHSLKDKFSNEDVNLQMIQRAAEIKSEIVRKDPFEQGLRKILNFGHTAGHALETLALNDLNQDLPHGFAVAQGMLIEAYLSYKLCKLPEEDLKKIQEFICNIYPKFKFSTAHIPSMITYMKADKKNQSGKIMASLLSKIGSATPQVELQESHIIESLEWYGFLV